jgi:Glycosyl hydrolase catalytic core
MKKLLVCLLLLNACSGKRELIENQIPLTPDMVINESGQGEAEKLVDEQLFFGGIPVSRWEAKAPVYPVSAVIDLGREYALSDLHFFDGLGSGAVTFSYGKPFAWQPLFADKMDNSGWQNHPLTVTTRYIRLEAVKNNLPIEIILQGKPVGKMPDNKVLADNRPKPTFDQLTGTNAFIDDPLGLMQVGGTLREYHNWYEWTEPVKGKMTFNPGVFGWDFDAFYTNLHKSGVLAVPCLQQSPAWVTDKANREYRPHPTGADPLQPASYTDHAGLLFQYAARYGKGKVADNQLTLAPEQIRNRNLGVLTHYENWNEPDKNWINEEAYFTPYQYAAMSSADYDGDQGRLKGNLGLKNADPQAKMVMAGIIQANLSYIKALKFWCDHKRNGSFAWDVINVHWYSHDHPELYKSRTGISPEADSLKEKMQKITQFRDRFLPGVAVWVTEFGYDVSAGSKIKAPAIAGMSAEEVQAIWNVRSVLAFAAAGVDRATQYMLRDAGGTADPYASSGLSFNQKSGSEQVRERRPGWFYLHTLKSRLAGMQFEKEVPSGNAYVKVYQFQHEKLPELKAYVVWCATSEGKTVENFSLQLDKNGKVAQLITLEDKQPDGKEIVLSPQNQTVILKVSEKPSLVIASGKSIPKYYKTEKRLLLTPKMLVNEGVDNAESLVDEQNLVGDPDMGNAPQKPLSGWNPVMEKEYLLSAYLDLGKMYEVSKVYINDGTGTGNLSISTGSPGNWTVQARDAMFSYQVWKGHAIYQPTRYLRFTRAGKSVGVFEVAVYVKE